MPPEPRKPARWLTEAQDRTLSSTLQYLEDRILALLFAIEGGPYARSLTRIDLDISPAQREACRERLEAMLRDVEALARVLEVEPDIISLRRRLLGGVSSMWEHLEDSRAAHLRRYGRVHPRLAEVLDPPVEAMLEHVEALRVVLEPPEDGER